MKDFQLDLNRGTLVQLDGIACVHDETAETYPLGYYSQYFFETEKEASDFISSITAEGYGHEFLSYVLTQIDSDGDTLKDISNGYFVDTQWVEDYNKLNIWFLENENDHPDYYQKLKLSNVLKVAKRY